MKKLNLFAALAAILALVSCQKKEEESVTLNSVTLTPSEISITEGDSQSISVSVDPENYTYETIAWKSSDENIASVSSEGVVTGKGVGSATITATIDGVSGSCKVTVLENVIKVSGVSLDSEALTISLGGTASLTATVEPADASNKTVTWSSSDEKVATVSDEGLVTAISEGTCSVTVTTTDGGFTASCSVSVVIDYPSEISFVDAIENTILEDHGTQASLTVNYSPESAVHKDLEWSVSDESLASVASTGEGTATVTFAESGYGFVSVTAKVKDTEVSTSQKYFVKGGEPLYALPTDRIVVDRANTYSLNPFYNKNVTKVTWTVGERGYEGSEVKFSLPATENTVHVSVLFGEDVTLQDSVVVSADEFLLLAQLDNGVYVRNTHPVFNKAGTRAYILLDYGARKVQEINLETGELGWSFDITAVNNITTKSNGPDISVNPITGDIYCCDTKYIYALTSGGALKWQYDTGMTKTFAIKGTAPIVSNDGSVVIVSVEGQLASVDASTGVKLSTYKVKGRAQMAIYGDNKLVVHTHGQSSTEPAIRFLSIGSDGKLTEDATLASPLSEPTISDLATCADNKAQDRVYFGVNGNSGATVAVNLTAKTIDGYFSQTGEHWSPVITESGFIYQAYKGSSTASIRVIDPSNLSSGGTEVWTNTSNGVLNHQSLPCDRDGNVYFVVQDATYTYFYKGTYTDGTLTFDVISTLENAKYASSHNFQACFNAGNGYLVAGLGQNGSSGGYIAVRCFDGERAHSWSGQGGDICESGNANLVYGE